MTAIKLVSRFREDGIMLQDATHAQSCWNRGKGMLCNRTNMDIPMLSRYVTCTCTHTRTQANIARLFALTCTTAGGAVHVFLERKNQNQNGMRSHAQVEYGQVRDLVADQGCVDLDDTGRCAKGIMSFLKRTFLGRRRTDLRLCGQ